MRRLPLFYLLVFISGFSGLVYEVVWHRYLAILLGAQAWATAMVLAVYLGGLSAGYFAFGEITRRYRGNLLMLYAAVETGLALWACVFPPLFQAVVAVVPRFHAGGGFASFIVDLGASIVLLGVPTVLMGGTLPILTQGLQVKGDDVSQTHARLYGFNTVGACFGCLLAGYWLIPSHGLDLTTRLGGSLNGIVALIAWFAARGAEATKRPSAKSLKGAALSRNEWVIVGIGFLSGFYLLALQTVLIRLMGLSSGASHYSFSLIVSIFVFCLGFGSLAARKIGKYKTDRLFWNQACAAFALLLLYVSGNYWSYGAHLARIILRDLPQTFDIYQALLGVALFGLLVIPIGLSGLTLPLCFHLLRGANENAVGSRVGLLYGVNTLGCIAGALIGGYWLLHFLNLDQIFKLCLFAVTLTAVAAAYLSKPFENWSRVKQSFAVGVVAVVLTGATFAPLYNKDRFIQPFRHPYPLDVSFQGAQAFGDYLSRNTKLAFWKDGPNTSLGVGTGSYKGQEVSRTVLVNGKSDGNTRGDLLTTNMLAHLPGLFALTPNRACIIGFGTGMTVGTLAQYPQVDTIDVVEISGTIIQNAGMFDKFNNAASKNAKVMFREMDAMRFLASESKPFDVIISEPSNPWVSGVENLFALEFYQRAQKTLAEDGMFVQWVHTYSFNNSLFSMIVGTMGKVFPSVTVFQLKGGDYALVGMNRKFNAEDLDRALGRFRSMPSTRDDLALMGIKTFETILALEVMGPEVVGQVAYALEEPHTLVRPRLSDPAAKAFFLGNSANVDDFRRLYRIYFTTLDKSLLRTFLGDRPLTAAQAKELQAAFCAGDGVKSEFLCRETMLMSQVEGGVFPGPPADWVPAQTRALASLPLFKAKASRTFGETELQDSFERFEAFKRYASPIFYIQPPTLSKGVDACLKTVSRKSEVWGQCLLQRILILEWLAKPSDELKAAKADFRKWFPTLDPKSPNYAKLKEAREILDRLQ